MDRRDISISVRVTLEMEIERIFGEDGVRNLVTSKIESLKRFLEDDSIGGGKEVHIKRHDDLIEYLEVLNGKLPF